MKVRGRELHFGVQLQAQATSWDEYAYAVREVERLGFGSIWNFDHMLPFAGPDERPCFETLTTSSAMALLTHRARIGVLVNGVLYRDPATLAKAAAQVDHMSGGRLDFSLGAAWAEREFRAYGLGFPSLQERHQRLDEALQVVKSLWSQERTTFSGRFYQLVDAPCAPKPRQSPHPPVTVGGSGRGTLRIAARHADRVNLIGSPSFCAEKFQLFESFCAEAGRDPRQVEYSVHPALVVAPTDAQAEALAVKRAEESYADLSAVRDAWLIGSPATVAARLREYAGAGVSHFVFSLGHPFVMSPFELFMSDVVPALG
jgi:F420-dependent oxidoreductase-like protein